MTAFLPHRLTSEHVAGEVKKSVKELDSLIDNLHILSGQDDIDAKLLPKHQLNAYNKLLGLQRRRAPLFWAIGPGAVSHLFEVSYSSASRVTIQNVEIERLAYPGPDRT